MIGIQTGTQVIVKQNFHLIRTTKGLKIINIKIESALEISNI